MGGVFSSHDNDNNSRENDLMLNKSVHRGGSNQRKNKNKNTTSKNKPKKSVSFSDITNENDDLDNDNNNDESSDNDNDYDTIEQIAKKRKPRKQSVNSTKKRRYN